jgi:hypothetical protein
MKKVFKKLPSFSNLAAFPSMFRLCLSDPASLCCVFNFCKKHHQFFPEKYIFREIWFTVSSDFYRSVIEFWCGNVVLFC